MRRGGIFRRASALDPAPPTPLEGGGLLFESLETSPSAFDVQRNGSTIGTVSAAPWRYAVTELVPGPATYQLSRSGTPFSSPQVVSVTAQAPTVLAPDEAEEIPAGDTYTLSASVFDDDATTGVDFRVTGPSGYNQTFAATLSGGTWDYEWEIDGLEAGTYTRWAVRHTAAPDVESAHVTFTLEASSLLWDIIPTGCVAGWRGDLGVTNVSGACSSWASQVPGGGNLTQGTAGNRPAIVAADADFAGIQSLSFDASNDILVSDLAASAWKFLHDGTGATIFLVVRPNGASGTRPVVETSTTGTAVGFRITHVPSTDRFQFLVSNGTTNVISINTGSAAPEGSVYGVLVRFETAATPDAELHYPPGTVIGSASAAVSSSDPANSLRVGNASTQKLAELVIWNRRLSDGEVAAVLAYKLGVYG